MLTVATICARGGSVRVPRKNLRPLNGKPLILYTIEQAIRSPLIDITVVSTDCPEIADVSRQAGALVPFIRPEELSGNDAGKHPVVIHSVNSLVSQGYDISCVVDLQPTSPLRSDEDIYNCLQLLTDKVDVVFSVSLSNDNPYFNLVERNSERRIMRCKSLGTQFLSIQKSPTVYALNGAIYAWHYDSLEKGLWGGHSDIYVMPSLRSVDIDTDLDFEYVEFLLNK